MLARLYETMTSHELAVLPDLEKALAVIPIAAIEAHGPHLPLGTDAIIADAMVQRAADALPMQLPVTFLPTLRLGLSPEHARLAGTLTLPWQNAVGTLAAMVEGLCAAGFRRLLFISSHGGNTPAMELAAMEARQKFDALAATASWQRFGIPQESLPEAETAYGIHGGAIETALMLAFRPDLVRVSALAEFPSLQSELADQAHLLRAHGRLGFAWLSQDLNPQGVVGDARLGTAELGEAIARHQVAGFCQLVADLLAFDLSKLHTTPA